MTWIPRCRLRSASRSCTTARSSSRARAPKWSRTRARARFTLGRDIDAADALRVADYDVILNAGRIVYDGPAEDARNQPDLLHAAPRLSRRLLDFPQRPPP